MNWRHIKTVWQKEIVDTGRDRRTLIVGILAPMIVMPLLALGSWTTMRASERKANEERTPIAVTGAAEAPLFLEMLIGSGAFRIVPAANPLDDLRAGRVKLVLRIPPGFERQATSGREPAALSVDYAASEVTSPLALAKLQHFLDGYQTMAQARRLGLDDPRILQTIRLEERNVSTPREVGGMLLGFFLPFSLAIWGITGGMYTAIDAVAGEKERRTLETLVVAPPSRASLAIGKALAVLTISAMTIMLSLFSTYLSFRFGMPLMSGGDDLRMELAPGSVGLLMLAALPYLAMLAGVEVALSAFGRSFKETQNYFTILMFLVMLPGMALSLFQKALPLWVFALPFANAVALFKGIFTGSWHWAQFWLSAATNLIYMAAGLYAASRLLADERAMFRG